MVDVMKPGSVIVDLAASNGGNVAGTVADEASAPLMQPACNRRVTAV